MDDRFAFIIHPINTKRDISRKYPHLGRLPAWLLNLFSIFYPPVFISEIRGIRSNATGTEISGCFVACPLSPVMMMKLPPAVVYRKIVQTGRLAEKRGARILGLGAFTSVVGDGGISVAAQLDIPVTTGDSYTVAVAARAIEAAAKRMHIDLSAATLAVVGAYGAIGGVTAQLLAPQVNRLLLIGPDETRLASVAEKAGAAGCPEVVTDTDLRRLREAHLVVTVTSAIDAVIRPDMLRQGAVVCDVARPRDVSRQVVQERPDVLVIEGGMVKVPGRVEFGFDFGFPPEMAYACMAETMALTLEKKYVNFTLGKSIALAQVLTIDRIAHRHGFQLGGFRSFERAVTDAEIARVLANYRLHPATASPAGPFSSKRSST